MPARGAGELRRNYAVSGCDRRERALGCGVKFQFDATKSAANRVKHGIDFVEAQAIWDDVDRLEVPARTSGEARVATFGRLRGEVWVAIWTPRGETVRLISVRRASAKERLLYEA